MRSRQIQVTLLSMAVLCLVPCLAIAGGKSKNNQISDEDISSAITFRLVRDDAVASHLIDVKTTDGIVELSGSVDNILAKNRAVNLARTIKGVRSVIDQMQVKPVARTDNEIRQDIQSAFLFDPATESYEVTANVNNGKVKLTGTVQSWQEKQLAQKVAMGVKGVKKVENDIDISYKINRSDNEIKKDIKRRLETDVWVDDALIDVKVDDGVVKLSGTVGSASEKYRAYSDAWVTGVMSVNSDKLKVQWWERDKMRRKDNYLLKSDEEIAEAVKDAFLFDPRVLSFNPEVSVDNGIVTLTGVVKNLKAKRSAGRDAKNTLGVISVKNHLRVRPETNLTDEQIARNIRSSLRWDPDVSRFEISVSVFNGKAYITGEVDSYFEKFQAEDIVSEVNGVVDVDNNLRVDYDPAVGYYSYPYFRHPTREYLAPRTPQLKEDIQDELYWSPYVDSTKIQVSVDGEEATLSGTVSSLAEMNKAIENALEGGANNVVNNLRIRSQKKK